MKWYQRKLWVLNVLDCYLISSIELTGWISAWPSSRRSSKYVPVTLICWRNWGTLKIGPLNPLHSPLLKGWTSDDVSGCWHIISDQIPPCITGLKLAFVTVFLYGGSKANGNQWLHQAVDWLTRPCLLRLHIDLLCSIVQADLLWNSIMRKYIR